MTHWVWADQNWPDFDWDVEVLSPYLSSARLAQGRLLGIIQTINSELSEKVDALIMVEQAVDTSAIEGERLSRDSVRSSLAIRLGLDHAGINKQPDRYIEGLLDMLMDATQNYNQPLTLERLCGWHAALFPTGYSGIRKITVGALREPGPMQIVSGRPDKPTIHYVAPAGESLKGEVEAFLTWFNAHGKIDGLLRAGLAHLWFELLHPFEDGNGRVGRAIIDLALAQDEQLSSRYYSLSSAIMDDRKNYYASLGEVCRGSMDITAWLVWFLTCFENAVKNAIKLIKDISFKSRFWEVHQLTDINKRQEKVLNRLLDVGKEGFVGGMTTRKYMQLTRTSRATAYRELSDLVDKRCLKPIASKGRSAAYEIDWAVIEK